MAGVSDRANRLYKVIDSDESGLISRRELEQLLVQGGSTPASASESMDTVFKQGNLEGVKHVNITQFKDLFTIEQALKEEQAAYVVLELLESVVGRLPSDVRAKRIFTLIDSDDSGLISRRELEQLMVQGGSSPATASMSADKLFAQANMGNMKQVTQEQFLKLFETEKNLRGIKSEDDTLKWFESLVEKLPTVYHHHYTKKSSPIHKTGLQSKPQEPVWFEKPINSPTKSSDPTYPMEEERPNTATRNIAARAEARRRARGIMPSKPSSSSSDRRDTEVNSTGEGSTVLSSNESITLSSTGEKLPSVNKRMSRRMSVEIYPLNGDVSKYSREGKTGPTFTIAGCDARMLATFHRVDIDGHGRISKHELESHMSHCNEFGGEAAGEPGRRAMECVKHSEVKPNGTFALEDFAHLFRAEIEAKGEASAISMLRWFEMVASRLPKHEEEHVVVTPSKLNPNSFLPRSLSMLEVDDNSKNSLSLGSIHETAHTDEFSLEDGMTPRLTTPPTTAVGSGMRGKSFRVVDGLGLDGLNADEDNKDSLDPTAQENKGSIETAAELLEGRLEQVAQRAEVRKLKKREKLCKRAESLHFDMMKLKKNQLLGKDNINKSPQGLSLAEIVELLMTNKRDVQVPLIDATKSAREIFDQAGVSHDSLMMAEGLKSYASKEIDLRGERSCDDMLRWLESLTKARGSMITSMVSDESLSLPPTPASSSSTTLPAAQSKSSNSSVGSKSTKVKPIATPADNGGYWQPEDDMAVDDMNAEGQPMVVACAQGAAETVARKSMRRKDSFTVPVLQNTPQGSSMDEENVTKATQQEGDSSTIRAVTPQITKPVMNTPSVVKAQKLTKAAASAKAHYLRTAVDPVFVPLLDSVVRHKPRDVTTFIAETCLKQLIERGSEAEKEVVRAMMKRILQEEAPTA